MKEFIAVSLILVAVLLSGCVEPEPVGCTADAMVCPDGSTVGRDPNNNCEFPACPINSPPVEPLPEVYNVAPDPMTGNVSLTDESKQRLFGRIASEGDSVLSELDSLSSLEYLDLSYSGVSDISSLSLPGLKEINLSYTRVSDLGPLAAMPSLESVNVSYSNAADISPVAGLQNLKKFWAVSCGVSDISALNSLANLKQVNLRYNAVNQADCDALQASLPDAQIVCS